ncbi:MAG: ferric reductase-like transmembrane domain-containing protein [Acholeplasmataceae bacterium]|nr:ferric reductase-like transmembrane domain-containing protein [Acholeplasmataceae bacterium]
MVVLVFLMILTILALYAGKFIRMHNVKIYILAAIISVLAFIFKDKIFTEPIMGGFLGLSFFYIVMITGAIDKIHKIKAKFMGLRREYSIIGFIAISPHALNYTLQGLNGTRALEWFGIISFVLMIPLFITSFLTIRKKMKAKTWNLIQSAAYMIYLLLFIHLILNYSKTINLVLYILIFGFYFVMKTIYEIKKYKTKKSKQKLILT